MTSKIPVELLQAAVKARTNAYAPYSNFKVGAAVETVDGSVYVGANMENASYGVTMCAEVGALQSASTAGQLAHIRCVAVVGGCVSDRESEEPAITPCGRCRQLIYEASRLRGRELDVWCADAELKTVMKFTISELLPHGFFPEKLGSRQKSH
jgi:cytidine deaminase